MALATVMAARPMARMGSIAIKSPLVGMLASQRSTSLVLSNSDSVRPPLPFNYARTYVSSPRDGNQLGGFSGSLPTYFQSKPPLPMNTVVRFVPQQTAWIVERMGKFSRILQPGLAILIPFLDRIAYVKSLKENAIEIPSQSCITADNVTLELDGVLYTRVVDAYKAR